MLLRNKFVWFFCKQSVYFLSFSILMFSSFMITWLDEFLGVPFLFRTSACRQREEDSRKCRFSLLGSAMSLRCVSTAWSRRWQLNAPVQTDKCRQSATTRPSPQNREVARRSMLRWAELERIVTEVPLCLYDHSGDDGNGGMAHTRPSTHHPFYPPEYDGS